MSIVRSTCLISLLLILFTGAYSQIEFKKISTDILNEGKNLYLLEQSAWIASDSSENKIVKEDITGFISLFDKDIIKVLFYNKINEDEYSVIQTFKFSNSIELNYIGYDDHIRSPNNDELYFIQIKEGTYDLLDNFDMLFKEYENTGFNISIFEEDGIFKIFIMSGAQKYGILPLGNDLEFKCNKKEPIIEFVRKIHTRYIPINLNNETDNTKATVHYHADQSSKFISSTDICTILLYKNMTDIKKHIVVSDEFISVFNSEKLTLEITKKEDYNIKHHTNF